MEKLEELKRWMIYMKFKIIGSKIISNETESSFIENIDLFPPTTRILYFTLMTSCFPLGEAAIPLLLFWSKIQTFSLT
jgi:hypothetical protein